MPEMVRQSQAVPRFSAILIGAFSAMALLLAAIGVFGLVAYSVSQRRLEFLSRFVERYLYGIQRLDMPTFAGAAALMIVVAGLAAWIPARRAMRASLRESM
jgi:putative ABC transport system permease protein